MRRHAIHSMHIRFSGQCKRDMVSHWPVVNSVSYTWRFVGGGMIETRICFIMILNFPSTGVEEGPTEYSGTESNHPHSEEAQGEKGRGEKAVRCDFQQNGQGQWKGLVLIQLSVFVSQSNWSFIPGGRPYPESRKRRSIRGRVEWRRRRWAPKQGDGKDNDVGKSEF